MRVVGDVKCYHCGHISGQVEGVRRDRLVFHAFKPRQGFQGELPRQGQRIRCERCEGPVFVEDLRPAAHEELTAVLPRSQKRPRSSRGKAA